MTKEWEMVQELLKAFHDGDIELYDDHLLFLCNPTPAEGQEPGLNELLDEDEDAGEQLPEWKIKKLYWLYDWKIEGEYTPFEEYEVEK